MKFLVSALFVCMMVAMAAAVKRCDQLPTNKKHDAREACQPFAHNLYFSNYPKEDKCIQLYYFGNRNGNKDEATALFQTEQNAISLSLSVDVSEGMDQWNTTDDAGNKISYRKLLLNDEEHFFCLYSCEDKGEFIEFVRCFGLNDAGAKSIDATIKDSFKDLPFRTGQSLQYAYNCEKHRPGGLIETSGSGLSGCHCKQ